MIKNRELALIPDSALELLEPAVTSPAPDPGSRTNRTSRATDRRVSGRPEQPPRS